MNSSYLHRVERKILPEPPWKPVKGPAKMATRPATWTQGGIATIAPSTHQGVETRGCSAADSWVGTQALLA
jgi:hypothetical protein